MSTCNPTALLSLLSTIGGVPCMVEKPDTTNPVCKAMTTASTTAGGDLNTFMKEISKTTQADWVAYFATAPGKVALGNLTPLALVADCVFTGGTKHFTSAERASLMKFKTWLLLTLNQAATKASWSQRMKLKVGTDLMLGESKDFWWGLGGVVVVTVIITALLAHGASKNRRMVPYGF